MSIDHDLQNLEPLPDEDREALESGYVAMANSIPKHTASAPTNALGPLDSEEIIDTLQSVLTMLRLVAMAVEGANFDGADEIRHAIFRHAQDPLYELIAKLGRKEDAEVSHG